ncbi:MAG: YkgJ family cysteine cluster protein [Sphaerochaetaceae bacterium]
MSCFYEEGLHFTCKEGCHYCCGVEPGYVFVSQEDLERIGRHLSLAPLEVVKRYCRKVSMGSYSYISLLERENHDCIFLSPKGCSIYPARPVQCATYPFWAPILESRAMWEREKQWCPGLDEGKLYTKEMIEEALEARRGVEPAIWEEIVQK